MRILTTMIERVFVEKTNKKYIIKTEKVVEELVKSNNSCIYS